MPIIKEVAQKIGPLCALQPDVFPPGQFIPLELLFEFDYRKKGLRDQFTLVESNVFTYPTFVADLRRRGGDTNALEGFKRSARESCAAIGAPLPMLFAIWIK